MKKETANEVTAIVKAIQDKKGHRVVIADLDDIDTAVCSCFIICEGSTPRQVEAIAESVGERLRVDHATKPIACEGLKHCRWVAIDYVDVMVHIFVPEERSFYNLENLWADAHLSYIPDVD